MKPEPSSSFFHALTVPYRFVVSSRAWLYQRGYLTVRRLPCPVISVGNLTVGGTGKTPLVIWIANWLCSKGQRVGILSRGYRRQRGARYVLVSDGRTLFAGPQEAGDEPFLMAKRCPGVLVAVGADRYGLGRWVLDRASIDCLILDDGFQHVQLFRDLNLLLIDALDMRGLEQLLPAGRLREPLSAANRATGVLLTRTNLAANPDALPNALTMALNNSVEPIHLQFLGSMIIHLPTGRTESFNRVRDHRVLLFSGIANPAAFRSTVESMGASILDEMVYPDHYSYGASDVLAIRQRAERGGVTIVLTTEKDAVKLESYLNSDDDIWAVRIEIVVDQGKERWAELLNSVLKEK